MMDGCPHRDIRWCPLYVAAHDGRLCVHGCFSFFDDDTLSCAIPPAAYADRVAVLRVQSPGFVEQIEWNEDKNRRQAQRALNLRVNGVH